MPTRYRFLFPIAFLTILFATLGFPAKATFIKYSVLQTGVIVLLLFWTWERFCVPRQQDSDSSSSWDVVLGFGLVMLLLYSVFSISWSSFRTASWLRMSELAVYAMWAFLLRWLCGGVRENIRKMIFILTVVGVCLAIASWVYYILGVCATFGDLPGGNPNYTAACLLASLMGCLGFSLREYGIWRSSDTVIREVRNHWKGSLWLVATVVVFISILMTQGLAAMLALVVTVFAFAVIVIDRRIRRIILPIIAGLLLVLLVLFIVRPSIIENVATSRTSIVRAVVWKGSWNMICARPILGWGVGSFLPNYLAFDPVERHLLPKIFGDFVAHAHSEPIEIVVELGIVGLLLAGAFVLVLIVRGCRVAATSERTHLCYPLAGVCAGFIGMCVQSFFSVGLRFWDVQPILWTTIGILWSASKVCHPAPEMTDPLYKPQLRRRVINKVIFAVVCLCMAGYWYFIILGGIIADQTFRSGGFAFHDKNWIEAANELPKVAEHHQIYHRRVQAQYLLSVALVNLKEYDDAISAFERLQQMAPGVIDSRLILGNLYLKNGQPEHALQQFHVYRDQNPFDARVYTRIAQALTLLSPDNVKDAID